MSSHKILIEKTETLQNILVACATGSTEENEPYKRLREELIDDPIVKNYLPQFLRTSRTIAQFWQFIKHKYSTYAERRIYIWGEFGPLLEMLESMSEPPSSKAVTDAL